MKSIFRYIFPLSLWIVNVVAEAQISQLDAVTITATRVEKSVDAIPAGISSVSQDTIQLGNEQLGLDESLNRVPGAFFLNRYNFAQDLRVSIRGFGARSNFGIRGVKIIVDDIPETLPDGQGSVDGVDIGSAQRIDVIRGPVSSLYGNASGGAIIIQTEDGPVEPFSELRATSGEFGFDKFQLKIGGDRDAFNYLVNASDSQIDGFRDHSEAENTQANAKLSIKTSESSSLRAVIHHTDQPVANDPGGLNAEEVAEDRAQARDRNLEFDAGEALEQTRLGVVYKTLPGKQDELEARVYTTQRDFNNRLPFENAGAVELDRQFDGGGLKYISNREIAGMNNRLLLGFDYDRQDDDRRRFDNLRGVRGDLAFDQRELVTALGIFLQNESSLSARSELTVGARYDNVKFDVSDRFLDDGDDSGVVEFEEISPMIGLSHLMHPDTRIYATISTAFETPTTTEFANPDGGGFNQDLDPQRSTNYEVGLKSRSGNHRFEAALFHIDVEDELIPFELESQPGRNFFENAGASDRDGFELAYFGQLGRGFEVSAAYTYSDFKFVQFRRADGESFDGNQIPGIPKDHFHFEISWFGDTGLYARWNTLYVGTMFADNANQDEIDPYSVSNFRFGYNGFVGDWEISPFAGINNLFDEEYNDNIRINAFGKRYFEPAPDQNAYFGITIRKNFSG